MKKKLFLIGAILILLLAGGMTWALAQGEGEGLILACAAKDGTLRLIASPDECKDKETVLVWNIEGPQGEKGDKGDQGEPGNLALAGQICPAGRYLSGFDIEGNIHCTWLIDPFTPVETNADWWRPAIQEFDGVPMALVPAGCFLPGDDLFPHEDGEEHCFGTPFWIDVYEVTNSMYHQCVAEGVCEEPTNTMYYGDPSYANHPVLYVDWNAASAYCSWAGSSLPDEWEWEYAARGPDALVYPWGDDFVSANAVWYENNCSGPCEVGSRPGGVSWVGAYDMSGNVLEWMVNDWDTQKVLRGNSWPSWTVPFFSSASRFGADPAYSDDDKGFRCSRSY